MIPTKIGRFEIASQIASGAEGVLYKANDPKTGRTVLVRCMSLRDVGQEMVDRFRAEAKAASALDSPNIAPLLGGGEWEGGFFTVTEFVDGITLRSRMRDKLPPYEVLDFCRQACTALDHAATRAIFHRNLTPANIVIEWDGNLKILDFGVPKNEQAIVASARCLERWRYRSPEQLRGEALDRRSNLYTWGAILYEMIAGKPAFDGETAEQLRQHILEETVAPVRAFNPAWDAGASELLLKALAKSREGRPASGADLMRELEGSQTQKSRPVPPPPIEVRAPQSAPKSVAAAATPASKSMAALEQPTSKTVAAPVKAAAPSGNGSAVAVLEPPPAAQHGGKAQQPQAMSKAAPTSAMPAAPAAIKAPTNGHQAQPATVKIAPAARKPASAPPLAQKLVSSRAGVLLVIIATASLAGGLYFRHRHSEAPPPAPVAEAVAAAPAPMPTVEAPVAPSPAPAGKRRRAAAPVAESLTLAAVTTGEMVVNSKPSGAQISLDGRTEPAWLTPYILTGISGGQHTVQVSKAGFAAQSRGVQIVAGIRSEVSLALVELPAVIAVSSEPAGAAILVDGKDTGRVTPAQLALEKGPHSITLRKPGFFEAMITAQLQVGQNFSFSPTLKPMGNADSIRSANKFKKLFGGAPKEMGSVQIRTSPKGARVTVNDRLLEKTTPLQFFLEPGNYVIVLTMDDYKPVRRMVKVERDSRLVLDELLER